MEDRLAQLAPTQRIGGENRFATAAMLNEALYDGPVDRVYIVSGSSYADALAAGGDSAPILLATRDEVPEETRTALTRMAPDSIVVLGGMATVAAAVGQQLLAFER